MTMTSGDGASSRIPYLLSFLDGIECEPGRVTSHVLRAHLVEIRDALTAVTTAHTSAQNDGLFTRIGAAIADKIIREADKDYRYDASSFTTDDLRKMRESVERSIERQIDLLAAEIAQLAAMDGDAAAAKETP